MLTSSMFRRLFSVLSASPIGMVAFSCAPCFKLGLKRGAHATRVGSTMVVLQMCATILATMVRRSGALAALITNGCSGNVDVLGRWVMMLMRMRMRLRWRARMSMVDGDDDGDDDNYDD